MVRAWYPCSRYSKHVLKRMLLTAKEFCSRHIRFIRSNALPGKTSFPVQNGRDVPFQTGFVKKWYDLSEVYPKKWTHKNGNRLTNQICGQCFMEICIHAQGTNYGIPLMWTHETGTDDDPLQSIRAGCRPPQMAGADSCNARLIGQRIPQAP